MGGLHFPGSHGIRMLPRADFDKEPELFSLIDGEKTIGELLLHTHASEFLVLKFLASAVHAGFAIVLASGDPSVTNSTLTETCL